MQSILQAAEQVIGEVGYDAATTNLIAARAGISPGSLYQYFAHKRAIVEALAQCYAIDLAAALDEVFSPGLTDRPIPELVDGLVDPIVAFHVAHPAAKALLTGTGGSPELAESAADLHRALCDRVETLLGELTPGRSAHDRHVSAAVSFQIFSGVLPAIVGASRHERPRLVSELKFVLVSYWTRIVAPSPDPR